MIKWINPKPLERKSKTLKISRFTVSRDQNKSRQEDTQNQYRHSYNHISNPAPSSCSS